MGVITRLPAKTVQQAGFLPAGGAITLTNRDGSGSFYYLVKTSGEIPTYAEVLAGTAVAVGGAAVKALSAKSWVWIASATGCDITVASAGLPAIDDAEDMGAIPFWSWLFKAANEDVTVEGTFLDAQGLAVGAGMGDQEVITSLSDSSWPQIYGTALWSALDYRSIVSAIVKFSGDVRARPGLNYDATVRGAVEASDILLPAGTYVFGALASGGVHSLNGGSGGGSGGLLFGESGSQVVSTTPLRVLGASSWTGAQTNGTRDRDIMVSNCDPSAELLLGYGVVGASLTGVVTAVKFEAALGAKGYDTFAVPAGYELVAVRAAVSTYAAFAREVIR